MMECFGRKADCKAPCEVSARCIEESGRVFSARMASGPEMAISPEITAMS